MIRENIYDFFSALGPTIGVLLAAAFALYQQKNKIKKEYNLKKASELKIIVAKYMEHLEHVVTTGNFLLETLIEDEHQLGDLYDLSDDSTKYLKRLHEWSANLDQAEKLLYYSLSWNKKREYDLQRAINIMVHIIDRYSWVNHVGFDRRFEDIRSYISITAQDVIKDVEGK